ncbi:RrF2 family transcriptional regulator [Nocardia donostiensis]|uniref:Transcriptional regulator n=1 Tax=Nocardia donostiensis TaxID=1538463 RepID=A0A1W0B6P8_9NOCA|nr:Rrf2 family transcriptional regulator [Nocardia donostiensis]ONM46489.1 transcriptional regulator [Nocardia donostiensis]OQS14280.1 transcriptional regulator [Nocardia donostiensis]OQS18111.1 transcriptional regulator [Nocardia donostiensis]
MHITAKVDHAVRTLLEIAGAAQTAAVKAESIAAAQRIPPKVLESVLAELRRAGLVTSRRGPDGGYRLARPAIDISIADVIRALEGPLASVRGRRPEDVTYPGPAEPLQRVWIALRVNIRAVLEDVSIADIAADRLPGFIGELTADPGAWARREPRENPVEITATGVGEYR